MLKPLATIAAAAAMLGLAACGNAEEAGENLDNAVEEAVHGETKSADGPAERLGESLDEATGAERTDDPADAINDATDGNPDTN